MIDARHFRHINILAKMAENVIPVRTSRIASCLVYQNDVIAFGTNRLKSHPFQSRFSKNSDSIYLHAETDVIKNSLKFISLKELEKSTLYVCRVKYTSSERTKLIFGLCKPCSGCMKAISTFNIRNVIYTLDGNTIEQL